MGRTSISDASRLMKIALALALISGMAAWQAQAVWGRVGSNVARVPLQAGAPEECFRPAHMTSESVPRAVARVAFVKDLINETPLATARGTDSSAQEEFFEKKIRPIFA